MTNKDLAEEVDVAHVVAQDSGGTTLRTPRLVLTPIAPGDRDQLLSFFNEPDVGRYLLDGTKVSRQWVESEIAASRARFGESGLGLWAVREASGSRAAGNEIEDADDRGEASLGALRDTGSSSGARLIGVVGFRPFFDPPELQLLYALHPDLQGRGLATEAASAALTYGFDEVGLDEVRAATDAPNRASVAVMERLGMEPWKTESGEPWETLFYRIGRERWMGRGGRRGE